MQTVRIKQRIAGLRAAVQEILVNLAYSAA